MRDIPRSLTIALIAGVATVFVASVPLAADTAGTQIVVNETITTQIPVLFLLFGGGAAARPVAATQTYSLKRSRVDDSDGTSTIQECDLQRTIYLDNKAKQYAIVPFSDYMKALALASQQVQPAITPTTSPGPSTGGLKVTLNEQTDTQTKVIAGQTTHHVIQEVQIDKTGTGDCNSMNISMHNDVWYATNPLPGYCPLPPVQNKAAAQLSAKHIQGRCMQQLRASANVKGDLKTRFPLDETLKMSLGSIGMGGSHTYVTSIATQPLNPSLFEIPTGYTQATPPPASPGT